MKRIWKRTLLILPLVAAMGLAGAWYVASGDVVATTKQRIAELNDAKREEGITFAIAYDSLKRSAFPKVGARIVNPRIEFTDGGDGAGRPPFSFEWKREGYVDFVSDIRTLQYQIASHGAGHTMIRADNQNFEIASEPSDITLVLTARDRAAFNAWQALDWRDQTAVQKALQDLSGLSFTTSDVVMVEATTRAPLYSQQASSVQLVNRSTDERYDADATIQVKGSQITKEYSDMLARFTAALQMPLAVNDEIMPFSATRAGKQNVDIDARVNLPRNTQDGIVDEGYIHVTRFTATNDFYTLTAPFDVVISKASERRTANIKGKLQFQLSEAGGQEMNRPGLNHSILMALSKQAGAASLEGEPALLQEKLALALPNVSGAGPVTLDVDIEVSTPLAAASKEAPAPQEQEQDQRREMLTVNQLAFGHARWGMDVKGMLVREGKNQMTVDFTVICQKCETMTRDIYDVMAATQDVMNLLNPKREPWYMNDEMLANINNTLAEIGRKDEATGDIVFGIGSPTPNDIRINDKPFGQAMLKFMMVFVSPEKAKQLQAISGFNEEPVDLSVPTAPPQKP